MKPPEIFNLVCAHTHPVNAMYERIANDLKRFTVPVLDPSNPNITDRMVGLLIMVSPEFRRACQNAGIESVGEVQGHLSSIAASWLERYPDSGTAHWSNIVTNNVGQPEKPAPTLTI